ncbi:hypothetical protein RhiirA5_476460 [Rhizophagus irregularis]|uniref:Uncharacterized protein n=2 Tax=Rhizophagus irregularis TaxID=588596 RepID=A0A2I1DY65_9GLOM|nr:hypothetical protein RirG_191990 [Rhizophagus irregularis DAOM 197198w]PKC08716.1 hypothetical protein RhiirA5_476460 [Rhizophagus irregularis]GBC15549.2 hypothetical protein GLOIN_2v1503504 [Rhizophagus irregularis DAOM 181602=DAOM 197198]PKC68146.1 hypothetical protein RhiirA1_507837 [Rhizophagus irregularis]PKK67111.1 hypothetical protein RhiirC2_783943 [Rhizophagus irregularis]
MDDDRRSRTSAGSAPTTFSNAKPKIVDPIRIECKKVAIKPTGAFLDTYTDVKLGVLFCHSTRDMYLCLNELKDKICIPYDQVTGFRIAEYKELEISLIPNFDRRFFQNGVEIKGDPSNGLLEKATSLLFIPCPFVSLNVLVSVEAAFGRYRTEIFLDIRDLDSSNIQDNNSNLNNEMFVRFYLHVERGGVIVPRDISFNGIIQAIESRFDFQLNQERISYKNGAYDMVAIRDEEDWKVAKWETKHSDKAGVMDLYLY